MVASKGGLNHDILMRITWRQFETYIDHFTWLNREQSDDGRRDNKTDDLITMKREPRVKIAKDMEIVEIKKKLKKHVDLVRDKTKKRKVVSKRALV